MRTLQVVGCGKGRIAALLIVALAGALRGVQPGGDGFRRRAGFVPVPRLRLQTALALRLHPVFQPVGVYRDDGLEPPRRVHGDGRGGVEPGAGPKPRRRLGSVRVPRRRAGRTGAWCTEAHPAFAESGTVHGRLTEAGAGPWVGDRNISRWRFMAQSASSAGPARFRSKEQTPPGRACSGRAAARLSTGLGKKRQARAGNGISGLIPASDQGRDSPHPFTVISRAPHIPRFRRAFPRSGSAGCTWRGGRSG